VESRSAGGGAAAQLACQCSHGSMGGPEGASMGPTHLDCRGLASEEL